MISAHGHRSYAPAHRHTRPAAGESRAFHFVSTWVVPAPITAVWDVLSDVDGWPGWWPGMAATRELPGESAADRARLVVRSPLGYRLRFTLELTRSEPPSRCAFLVSGDLRGRGFWAAEAAEGDPQVTRMTIGWCVVSNRRLVRAFAPLARLAHARVMAAGGAGLARRLGEWPESGLSR